MSLRIKKKLYLLLGIDCEKSFAPTHRFSLLIIMSHQFLKFKIGSTLKCRNAFGFDFTDLTHFCFSVTL